MQINTGNSSNNPVWIAAVCLLLGACQSATNVPSGIVPLNTMKEVMWDVTQAEVYANLHLSRDSTKNLKQETLILYQKVFSLHRITREQFAESMKYYEAHPAKHKILLDSLLQYATRMKDTGLHGTVTRPFGGVK